MDLPKKTTKLSRYSKEVNEQMKLALGDKWFELLKDEFTKGYFIKLANIVSKLRKSTTIYPANSKEIFSVFRNTDPYKIKCIILGMDPYPDGSYCGMAFSNKEDTAKISPSLRNIFKEIEEDIYDGFKIDQNPDLTRLQNQGVFLINRILTVQKNKPGSHRGIGWETFTDVVINKLSLLDTKKVFMLWGNDAKSIKPQIIKNDNNLILESGHPSPLSANRGYWFGNKHFSKTNEFLEENNLTKIKW